MANFSTFMRNLETLGFLMKRLRNSSKNDKCDHTIREQDLPIFTDQLLISYNNMLY